MRNPQWFKSQDAVRAAYVPRRSETQIPDELPPADSSTETFDYAGREFQVRCERGVWRGVYREKRDVVLFYYADSKQALLNAFGVDDLGYQVSRASSALAA